MKYLILAFFLTAFSLATPQGAGAQSLSQMLANTGLSPEDFNIMGAASEALLAKGTPKPGAQKSWTNPESTSKGVVRVQAVRKNCVYFQHRTQPAGRPKPLEIRNRWCKDSGGNWVMVP